MVLKPQRADKKLKRAKVLRGFYWERCCWAEPALSQQSGERGALFSPKPPPPIGAALRAPASLSAVEQEPGASPRKLRVIVGAYGP